MKRGLLGDSSRAPFGFETQTICDFVASARDSVAVMSHIDMSVNSVLEQSRACARHGLGRLQGALFRVHKQPCVHTLDMNHER